jgi:hypothetical protein
MSKTVRLEGHVVRKRVNPGSKSDHVALVLVCASGEFTLRRQGGAPFGDTAFDALVGKRVRASGVVSAGQFIVAQHEVLGDA